MSFDTLKYSLIAVSLLLLVSAPALAQKGKLPPFRMMQADGKIFKAESFPMGKPIIVIYFSPDCDHCEKLMKGLIKEYPKLKKASIAMITYLPVKQVAGFVQRYHVASYPNIFVGTEGTTFFVRDYYKITDMPFMALHDSNGNLVKQYRQEGALKDLIKELNQL